jgi:hypothetical protein
MLRLIRSDVIHSVFMRSDIILSDVIRYVIIRSEGELDQELINSIQHGRKNYVLLDFKGTVQQDFNSVL